MNRTKLEALTKMKTTGLAPRTVIDVGASVGAPELYQAFPDCRHMMIEPIEENSHHLARICGNLKNADFLIAAASNKTGNARLQVKDDFTFSSLIEKNSTVTPNFYVRDVATITLDDLCAQNYLSGPFLVKVDVDGFELEVLEGATEILENTELLIVETALFNKNAQKLFNLIWDHGFALYDIADSVYRPFDGILWQFDAFFVKRKSSFRQHAYYSSPYARDESEVQTDPGKKPITWREQALRLAPKA